MKRIEFIDKKINKETNGQKAVLADIKEKFSISDL